MDRQLDEMMNELAKKDERIAELEHKLKVANEWCEDCRQALRLSCERQIVGVYLNYFDRKESEQISLVHDLMFDYLEEVRKPTYERKH